MTNKEPETYRMLPKTAELLKEDIAVRRKELDNVSQQGNEIWSGGDQWHSTTFKNQQQRQEVTMLFLQLATRKEGKTEVLQKPSQTETVEIGHMIKVKLPDDQDIIEAGVEHSLIHLLSEDDAHYLGPLFDGLREMVAADISPLGKALTGLRRGMTAKYLKDSRLQVLDTEDAIQVSNLFDRK
jgi:hypothetical protein